jgi:hypothetical protein
MGGMMGGMMAEAYQQGRPLELLDFVVRGTTSDPGTLPERLPALPELPDPAASVRERSFSFNSRMMMHDITGGPTSWTGSTPGSPSATRRSGPS